MARGIMIALPLSVLMWAVLGFGVYVAARHMPAHAHATGP
jgi:hypothetical protein